MKYLCKRVLEESDSARRQRDAGDRAERVRRMKVAVNQAIAASMGVERPRSGASQRPGRDIIQQLRDLGPEPDPILDGGHVIWKRQREELLEQLRLDALRRSLDVSRSIRELDDPVLNAWHGLT